MAKPEEPHFWRFIAGENHQKPKRKQGTPKKTAFEAKPKSLFKVLFFLFFGFEVLGKLSFSAYGPGARRHPGQLPALRPRGLRAARRLPGAPRRAAAQPGPRGAAPGARGRRALVIDPGVLMQWKAPRDCPAVLILYLRDDAGSSGVDLRLCVSSVKRVFAVNQVASVDDWRLVRIAELLFDFSNVDGACVSLGFSRIGGSPVLKRFCRRKEWL